MPFLGPLKKARWQASPNPYSYFLSFVYTVRPTNVVAIIDRRSALASMLMFVTQFLQSVIAVTALGKTRINLIHTPVFVARTFGPARHCEG
jgi:hypothetical protein